MTNSVSYLYILCLVSFLLTACGSKKDTTEKKTEFDESDAVAVRDDVLKTLRSSQITAQLHSSGIVYNKELLHNVNRADHYLKISNKGAAAANLGIYMSDLNYLIAFDERDDAGKYFDACYRLSEFIGMKKQFSVGIYAGFNEVIAGDGTLEKSLEQIFNDADNFPTGDEFKKLHAVALTGYYIEELYHLTSFLQSYKSDPGKTDSVFFKTLTTLVDQKDELNNLITYFDHIEIKSQGISAYQDLLALQVKYLTLNRTELLQEKDPALIVNDKTLMDIFVTIASIRTAIINF